MALPTVSKTASTRPGRRASDSKVSCVPGSATRACLASERPATDGCTVSAGALSCIVGTLAPGLSFIADVVLGVVAEFVAPTFSINTAASVTAPDPAASCTDPLGTVVDPTRCRAWESVDGGATVHRGPPLRWCGSGGLGWAGWLPVRAGIVLGGYVRLVGFDVDRR
ncbi:hypothetical protein JOD54_002283 [Actinokineospora baliensis]|uniref:hypothetical protein n=1 Tax=Actinokineospora baliensis TaxID=547056 RepID=UPI0019568598|nr:hypothetical protein [Actinokineospora baliensis]